MNIQLENQSLDNPLLDTPRNNPSTSSLSPVDQKSQAISKEQLENEKKDLKVEEHHLKNQLITVLKKQNYVSNQLHNNSEQIPKNDIEKGESENIDPNKEKIENKNEENSIDLEKNEVIINNQPKSEPLPLYKEISYNLNDVVKRDFFDEQLEELSFKAVRLREKLLVLQNIKNLSQENNQERFDEQYQNLNQEYVNLKKDQGKENDFEEQQKTFQKLYTGFEFSMDDKNKKELLTKNFSLTIGINEKELEELKQLKNKEAEYSSKQKAYALMKALQKTFWDASSLRLSESENVLNTLKIHFTNNFSSVEKKEGLILQLFEHLGNIVSVKEAARIEGIVYNALNSKQNKYLDYCFEKNKKYYLDINDQYIHMKKKAQEKILELDKKYIEHADSKIQCDPKDLSQKLEEYKKIRKEIDKERCELSALLDRVDIRMKDLYKRVNWQLAIIKNGYSVPYTDLISYLQPYVGQKLEQKENISN